jgi:tetratricopeptide (TPR) repeat protein
MAVSGSLFDNAVNAYNRGDTVAAVALCRQVKIDDTQHPDALHLLGVIAHERGNLTLALQLIEMALAKRLSTGQAWLNRAIILHDLGRHEDALQSLVETTRCEPKSAYAWDTMGIVLSALKREQEAQDCYRRALSLDPTNTKFMAHVGMSMYACHDLYGAYMMMRQAFNVDEKINPVTIGNILKSAGHPYRALPYLAEGRHRLPQQKELAINEAYARLQVGDYENGFSRLELRPDFLSDPNPPPVWKGQRTDHLLVYEDQGFGDAILASRYIPMLADRASTITLRIAPSLGRLFADSFPMVKVISTNDPMPTADARIRLMSLPAIFKTQYDTIPPAPLLVPNPQSRHTWRERLAVMPFPRVGFVWGGTPTNAQDHLRSLPSESVNALLKVGGKNLILLQKGPHRDGINMTAYGAVDADFMLTDFSETAALMAELDLVVTTCTSTAHLAGAVGRPTWLMLSFDPYWVWLLGREDSPWYPAHRLFRQTEPYIWSSVVSDVSDNLIRFIRGHKTVVDPKRWSGKPLLQNPNALDLPED